MAHSSDVAWPQGAPPSLVACHELLRDSLAYLTVPACRALAGKRLLLDGGCGLEAVAATLDRARSVMGPWQDRAALAVCLSTLLEAEALADGSAHLAQVAELWIPLVLSTPAAAAAWLAVCEAGLTRSLEAAPGENVDRACDVAIWSLEVGLHAAGARSEPLAMNWLTSGALSPPRVQLLLASQPAQQTVQRALACARASLQAAACLLQRGGSCSGERLDRATELLGAALAVAQGESEAAASLAPWAGLCGLLQKVAGAAGRGARFSEWLVATCRALSASKPDSALRLLSDCCREEGERATLLVALSPLLRASLGAAASSLARKRALYVLSELWQPPSLAQAAFLELQDTLNENVLHLIKEQWAAAVGAVHPPRDKGPGPDPPAAGDRLPWCWSSLLWTRGLQHSNQQAQKSIALSFFGRSWTAEALLEVPPTFVARTLLPALTAPHMGRGEDGAALQAEAAAWVQLYVEAGCLPAVKGAEEAPSGADAPLASHPALPQTLHLAFELLRALAVAEMPRKLSADLASALRVSGRALLGTRFPAEVSGEGLRTAALRLLREAALAQRGQGQNTLVQAMLGDLLAGGLLLSGALAEVRSSPLTPEQAICLGEVLASQPLATVQSGGPLRETVSEAANEGVLALPESASWDEIFELCRALDESSSAGPAAAQLPDLAARPSVGGTVLARLALVASLSRGGSDLAWLDRACAGGSDFAWTALGFVLQAATPVDARPAAWDADQALVAALAGLLERRAQALCSAAKEAARELSRLGEPGDDASSDACGWTLQSAVRALQALNAAASFAAHPLCRNCVDSESWVAKIVSPLTSSLARCGAALRPVPPHACPSPAQQRAGLGKMLGFSACVGGQLKLALAHPKLALAHPAAVGNLLSRPQILAWALQTAEAGALPHSQRSERGESHWSARSVALGDRDRAGLTSWRVAADCLEALEQLDSERDAGCRDAAREADAAPRLLLACSSCLSTANEHDLVPLLRCLRWALPKTLDQLDAAETRGEAPASGLAQAAQAAQAHPLVPASCRATDALLLSTLERAWLAFSRAARRRSAVAGALVSACLQPGVLEQCAAFGVGEEGGKRAGEESQSLKISPTSQSAKPTAWISLHHLSEDAIKKRLAQATPAFSPAHALVARLLRLGAKSSRIATLTALQLCGSLVALPHAAASFLPLLEALCLFGFADAPSCAEGALEAQPLDAETAGALRHVPGLVEGPAPSVWRAWECAPRVAAVSLLSSWARRAREGEEAAGRACRAVWARLLHLALTDPVLSSSQYQYHGETHRIKVRLWQAVCALSPGVWEDDPAGTRALDEVLAALKTSEASSVKQYQETCALCLLGSPPAEPALRRHVLRELRELGSAKRDALPSLILVAAQAALESERSARKGEGFENGGGDARGSVPLSPLVSEVVHCLVPWTLVHVHAIRTFAQLAVWRLLELFPGLAAESPALAAMGRFFAANADVRRLRSALGEGRDLDAFRLENATSPEGILHHGAACAGRSEELAAFEGAPLALIERIQGFLSRERVVLRADLRCRLEQSLRSEYERGGGSVPRAQPPASQPRQRKITPEDALAQAPPAQESAGAEMQRLMGSLDGRDEFGKEEEDWEPELGLGPKRQELIVVASLIDKIPNLAGLARTCEVMRATALVLSDASVVEDPQFQSISVTAALWMPIREVPEIELEPWLNKMASQGWSLVGLEQTSESISLPAFAFPEKTILVLGREKEGVPVNLLRLLHHAVEIPQLGVIRSLNVHVSGAIAAYEYTRQNLARRNL